MGEGGGHAGKSLREVARWVGGWWRGRGAMRGGRGGGGGHAGKSLWEVARWVGGVQGSCRARV